MPAGQVGDAKEAHVPEDARTEGSHHGGNGVGVHPLGSMPPPQPPPQGLQSNLPWAEGAGAAMRATSVIMWSKELHREPRKILMMEDMLPDIRAAAMRNPPRELKVEELLLPTPALQVAQYNTALLMLVDTLPREN